ERSGKRPTGTGPKWPTPSAEYQRAVLLRQRLNRAFTQSDRITLALRCQLDDLPGDDLRCGVGPIDQAQRAQGVFERGGEDPDLVRSKHMIFQQAMLAEMAVAAGSREPAPLAPVHCTPQALPSASASNCPSVHHHERIGMAMAPDLFAALQGGS